MKTFIILITIIFSSICAFAWEPAFPLIGLYGQEGDPPVEEEVEEYYLTQNGGGEPRDGKSLANAWSLTDFNDPAIWSTTQDVDRIDPDDIVYIKGSWSNATLVPQGAVIIDGLENGERKRASNEATGTLFSGCIQIDVDDVTIQDMRFKDLIETSISFGTKQSLIIGWGDQASPRNTVIQRNYFRAEQYTNRAINIGFAPYTSVLHNYYSGYYGACTQTYGGDPPYGDNAPGFIQHFGGKGFVMHNNYIDGGQEGAIFVLRMNRNPGNLSKNYIPPSSGKAIDPDFSFDNFQLSHNYLNWWCFEGFTMDGSESHPQAHIIDNDIVSSVNYGANTVTLTHNSWADDGNKWSGMAMGNICSRPGDCNKWTDITSQSGKTFTVTDASFIDSGDIVIIGAPIRNMFWHNNHVSVAGFRNSAYLAENNVYRSLFENNTSESNPYLGEDYGLWIDSHKWGYASTSDCWGTSGRPYVDFCSYNVVQNNLLGDFNNVVSDWSGGYAPSYVVQKSVAFIDNTFHSTTYYNDQPVQGEFYKDTNYYRSGTTGGGYITLENSTSVSDTWSSAVISEIRSAFPPTIIGVTVTTGSNYFNVTFGEVVTGNAACLAGGDCGISLTSNGTNSIAGIAYNSGSGTATWKFTYSDSDPTSAYQLIYDGSGDIIDDGGSEMYIFDYPMGHKNFTIN